MENNVQLDIQRIATALERIADTLDKLAKPPFIAPVGLDVDEDIHANQGIIEQMHQVQER